MTRRLREFLASVERSLICYDSGADRALCQYVINGFQTPKLRAGSGGLTLAIFRRHA